MTINPSDLHQAITCLLAGGTIAYPTEAVYGLGCDPFNEEAVTALLTFKQRTVAQGLILIASSWDQITPLIQPVTAAQLARVKQTWPGPITWTFLASQDAPRWITGDHSTIALRITAHPIAHQLCRAFKHPIVSTSANLSGYPPATTFNEAKKYGQGKISFILPGLVGTLARPTPIYDVITGQVLRR